MSKSVTRLGVIIFPGFALLDVAGPMQFFNSLSAQEPFELSIIAKTMDPVSTIPPKSVSFENRTPTIGEQWVPTHTFNDVSDLDILLVPGGFGVRDETIFNDTTTFIQKLYPKLKYLLAVCTGSVLVAGTGLLNGRKATSNKSAWSHATNNKAVNWIPKARWVVDGNIWTSSGVAAGMDMTYAFIDTVFSTGVAKRIADVIEYEPHTNSEWDPFCEIWNAGS